MNRTSMIRWTWRAIALGLPLGVLAGCAVTDRDDYYASRRSVITKQPGDGSQEVSPLPAARRNHGLAGAGVRSDAP